MKSLLWACSFVAFAGTSAFGAVAEDVSLGAILKTTSDCDGANCTGQGKMSGKVTYIISLSAAEESQLVSDTSVTLSQLPIIGTIPLLLSEDPNFQNGDTSAKIKKTIPAALGVGPPSDLNITANLKWGNGQLVIKASAKLVGTFSAPFPLLTKSKDSKIAPFPVLATVEGPLVMPTYTAPIAVPCVVKQNQTITAEPDNTGQLKLTISAKSQ